MSSCRHRQSDVAEMRVPFSFLKGSGSWEFAVKEPGSDTAQSAPSSSTPIPAAAAPRLPVAAVTAPATASAATASTTIVERTLDRLELMITRALLPDTRYRQT